MSKKMMWISPKMFLLYLSFSVHTTPWDAVSEWIAFLSEQRRWPQFKSFKPIIQLGRRQIFTIFDPYPPPVGSFFTIIRWKIWPIFDSSPSKDELQVQGFHTYPISIDMHPNYIILLLIPSHTTVCDFTVYITGSGFSATNLESQ